MSQDSFDIYVYELTTIDYGLITYSTRLLESAEITVGLWLILPFGFGKRHSTLAHLLSSVLLILFSVFLIFLIGSGETGNCHCMGDVKELSPVQSLIKNFIMLSLIFVSIAYGRRIAISEKKYLIFFSLSFVISLVIVCMLRLPDPLRKKEELRMSEENLIQYLNNTDGCQSYLEGEKAVCVLSPTCLKCKYGARKMKVIASKKEKSENDILVLMANKEKNYALIDSFMTNIEIPAKLKKVKTDTLIKISSRYPTFILLRDGVMKKSCSLRQLEDDFFD